MKRFSKEFGKGFFIGLLIFLVIGLIQFITGNLAIRSANDLLIQFFYNQMYAVVLYLVNAYFFRYLIEKYKAKIFEYNKLVKALVGGVLITLLSLFFLQFIFNVVVDNQSLDLFLSSQAVENYYLSLVISIVVTSIFFAFYYYKFKQDTKVKEQKLIAGTASAQFDALKNQLDPHFLFNSLNVLTSLIDENPKAATKFTTSLSKVYRYVLEQKSKQLVTVEEELKFAELYMSLLKMRFEDCIIYDAPTVLKNPEAKVVPLSLQLLLENAVKHNQVTPTKKLYIKIEEVEGHLIISNNVQPKQVLKESTGVGLKNIKQRYFLLTSRPVLIDSSDTEFKVSIPLLTETVAIVSSSQEYISDKKMERAREQLKKLKGFYGNLGMYLIFIPIFIWLNFKSNAGFPWAIFPIAGWGLGVLSHAAETFNWNPFFNKEWEERKIKEFMDKDQ